VLAGALLLRSPQRRSRFQFVHEHLRRTRVGSSGQFISSQYAQENQRCILAIEEAANVFIAEWQRARAHHHWAIGRYVIMPDYVHFFCRPEPAAKTLSRFVGLGRHRRPQPTAAATAPQALWQREFFDHLLRSSESYGEKWNYVRDNLVRSGLVASADERPFAGEIERLEF